MPGVRIPATFLHTNFPLFHEQKGGTLKAFIRAILSITCTCCLIAQAPLISRAQSTADVLAVVNNKTITFTDLKPFLPPGFDSFEPEKAFAVQKVALENAIISLLLKAEARRRKISVPTLRRQMTAGRVHIADRQIEDEFQKNARYFGMMSPDEAKERLRQHLGVDEHMKFYRAAVARLKSQAKVEIRLRSRRPPTVSLTGTGPSDGPHLATVTITMFSDFQCHYCRESQPILAQVLNEFPDDVRLVFRHLPLAGVSTGISPASAAVCADQQGRFWEYHDEAYGSKPLTSARLRQIAAELELDIAGFEQCIASPVPNRILSIDVAEARRLGITGTPAFIINGKLYKGKLEFWQFKELIESELAIRRERSDIDWLSIWRVQHLPVVDHESFLSNQ